MTADTIEVIGSASPSPDERPQTTSETGQNSPLLSLPLEVFQIIIRHMDAGTFYASLLTCRHFLKAARCKPNIKRHLYSLPGLRLGLDDVSTSALLLQFRRRAAESGCAAGVLADVTRYQQTSRTSLSNAVFSPADPSHSGGQAYVATVHNGGIVHVYDLGNRHVRLKAELHVRPQDGNDGRMEIVKMAFAPESRDLGVLYRHVPSSNTFHVGSLGHTVYKLVTFHYLYARTKGYFYDSHQQETRDIEVPDVEVPVGLALASNGRACMACKSQIEEDSTNVTLIGRDHKLMEACDYGESCNKSSCTVLYCQFEIIRSTRP